MRSSVFSALILTVLSLAQEASAACYTIYKNDVAIYQSSVAPVDMGLPLSQTVPARFGEGATMVYQQWGNSCAEFDGPAGFAKTGATENPPQGLMRSLDSSSNRAAASTRSTQPAPIPLTSREIASSIPQSYESVGAAGRNIGYSGTIQTGPRGGQYYVNSNGNKTYVNSGSSGRSGRR